MLLELDTRSRARATSPFRSSGSDSLQIAVECYAGYRGEQTPRAIVLGDRRVAVVDVLDQWLAPDHRYFKLRGDDRDVYIIRQDVASGEWTLTMFERGGNAQR